MRSSLATPHIGMSTGTFFIPESHPPESNRRPTDYESVALPTELGWPGWRSPTYRPPSCRSRSRRRLRAGAAPARARPLAPGPAAPHGPPAATGLSWLERTPPQVSSVSQGTSVASCRDDLEAQAAPIGAHAVVAAEQAQIWQRLAQQESAGEVKRIEGPDGLHGKGCLRALRHLSRHLEHAPAASGPCECFQNGGAPDLVEKVLGDRSPDHPSRFDEGQPGADDLRRAAEQMVNLVASGFVEQPPKHRAAFRVEGHRSARSASSSAWLGRAIRTPGRWYDAGPCGRPIVSSPAASSPPHAVSV